MTDLVQKLVGALDTFVERFKDHEDAGPRGETWQSDEFLAELAQARAALSEAKAGGWQPIETAPKDELILIYQPKFKRVTTSINDGFDWVHATLWQPLPAPPAQRGEG